MSGNDLDERVTVAKLGHDGKNGGCDLGDVRVTSAAKKKSNERDQRESVRRPTLDDGLT